jgi:DnaJ-class molecular chaperone
MKPCLECEGRGHYNIVSLEGESDEIECGLCSGTGEVNDT